MVKHLCYTVADRSYFSLLKKDIRAIAVSIGFNDNKVAEIDIIVAEIVSNLVKHGDGGNLLVKKIVQQDIEGIEFLAIDNGEGIADLNRMMGDGVSTTNTLGQGLGAIKRLSDFFQVYTQKEWGTILLSRVFKEDIPYQKNMAEIRTIVIAKPGEVECGDGYSCNITRDGLRLFLGDGLGHGKEASIAVNAAIDAYRASKQKSPAEAIRQIHSEVKKTRGLVGCVAHYSNEEKMWLICGVGNIDIRLINGIEQKTPMSYNGIIGHNIPNTLKDHEIPAENVQLLVMCSDGIRTKWDLWKYPHLFKYDLSIVAAVLFKDYARHTDDMSIVIVRSN